LGYIPLAEVEPRAWKGVEAIPAESVSLREHLLLQLHLAAAGVEETEAAEVLVEALDDDGYLRIELGELGAATGISPLALRQALNLVQTLDPRGVGARDLSECLLIQLGARGLGGSLAARVVRDHLVRLGEMRLGSIADQLGCAVEEVQAALEVVRALDPRPGLSVGANSRPRYVVPDVTVQQVARSYVVLPNDGVVPRVRISPFYKKLAALATGAAGAAGVAGAARAASEAEEAAVFLAKRLRDAVHLLRSVEQRRLTVCRVVERIVERQRAFFDHGVRHLAPLTLREVASDLGVHDSTVSRAVSGKYVETPRGTFELKFFFSSGLLAVDGGRVSSRSVKRVIGELIEAEDPSRPHSDRRLVELLGRRGASVSRRTVAKYRHELGVPSSARRRRY
jgi:RNA polymerase sigma-54 factor